MGELLRYLVSVDPAQGVVKVEQLGEAGDLTEVDAHAFAQMVATRGPSSGSAPQVVINIFGAGHAGGPARTVVSEPPYSVGAWGGPHPPHGIAGWGGPHPPHVISGWGGSGAPPAPPSGKPEDPDKK